MKYFYESEAYDTLMGCNVVSKCESDVELSKNELIKKWNLDGSDIDRFKLYEIINGKKKEIR